MWHNPLPAYRERTLTEGSKPVVIIVTITTTIIITAADVYQVPTLCQILCSAKSAGIISFNLRTSPAGEVRPILQIGKLRLSFFPKAILQKPLLLKEVFTRTLLACRISGPTPASKNQNPYVNQMPTTSIMSTQVSTPPTHSPKNQSTV